LKSLRKYQAEGCDFLVQHPRVILADEMGLGKTLEVLAAIKKLKLTQKHILVVCSGSSQYVWKKEVAKWLPELPFTMVVGNPSKRHSIWKNLPLGMVVCTYGVLRQDIDVMQKFWSLVIADEAHNLHNRKTKNFKSFKRLRSTYLFLVTGSPVKRGPESLWTFLHLIDRKVFSSYWRYVNAFCMIIDGPFGKENLGPKNITALKEVVLKNRLIRRMKVNVAPELPPKIRQLLPVEPTPLQVRIHKQLAEKMVADLPSGDLLVTPSILAKLVRLRQLFVTPKLITPELEDGAGLNGIVEHMKEISDQPHVVIFTPFAKAIPFIANRLEKEKLGTAVILKGGMKPNDVGETLEAFIRLKCIAICTIKFAQSFDLDTAHTGYFLGYEWEPLENYQAEDRLHRITTVAPSVNIYYIQHVNPFPEDFWIDEQVLEVLNGKQVNVSKVLKHAGQMRKMLAVGPIDSC